MLFNTVTLDENFNTLVKVLNSVIDVSVLQHERKQNCYDDCNGHGDGEFNATVSYFECNNWRYVAISDGHF